jgi:branched-chain amino acid transport system permease protein
MSLSTFFQHSLTGISLGGAYALIAIGYTMVYGILRLINFAHGDIFMMAGYFMIFSMVTLPWQIAIPLVLILTVILGVAVERVAYKPLRTAPRMSIMISAIGVSFILQDAVRLIEGLWKNAFYLTTPTLFTASITLSENVKIPVKILFISAISIIIMLALNLFVNKTKWGKAMRAVAQDQYTSSLMSINVNKIISLTFLIGAGLGGAAGTLFAVQYTLVSPYVGFILGMKAFTAAVFGGIGDIKGAMVGGILLGIIESFGSAFLGTLTNGVMGAEYKDVLAFVILIILLIFKPSGLFGKAVGEKV